MNRTHQESGDLDCERARVLISAHLDGEPSETAALEEHLAGCERCRAHERALAWHEREFTTLREPAPVTNLWGRIERRARRRPAPQVLARVAAALVGFVGLGGTALYVERDGPARAPERHLLTISLRDRGRTSSSPRCPSTACCARSLRPRTR
jgi:anti-sigma factor RsiW